MMRSPLAILIMATEWHSRYGGLSTLDRELCIALSRAGQRVVCAVPTTQEEEVAAAQQTNMQLVIAPTSPGADKMGGLFRRLRGYLNRPDCRYVI